MNRIARLSGPPYHFLSRVTEVHGPALVLRAGSQVVAEYDVPPEVWYLEQNDHPVMPMGILLEAALQAGGWLASYVGSALGRGEELLFRNLEGSGRSHREVGPARTLRTTTTLTEVATAGETIIETFGIQRHVEDQLVFDLTTDFGFFTPRSLRHQVGLPVTDADRAALTEPSDFRVDLTAGRQRTGRPRLPGPMLLMLDRATGYWPTGGSAGLGRLRAEKDVDGNEWFFRAHFFQDPVQPGSLGVQAIYQLLRFYVVESGLADQVEHPRFEPVRLGSELSWSYRGQVVPENRLVTVELDVLEVGTDPRGPYVRAQGWLWVDGKRIYHLPSVSTRVVAGDGPGRG